MLGFGGKRLGDLGLQDCRVWGFGFEETLRRVHGLPFVDLPASVGTWTLAVELCYT